MTSPPGTTSRLGPAIGLGSAQEAPDRVRARLEAADDAMALQMRGRRFGSLAVNDRIGAKPSRPETVYRNAAS